MLISFILSNASVFILIVLLIDEIFFSFVSILKPSTLSPPCVLYCNCNKV